LPHIWGRDDIQSVFELGNCGNNWRNPNISKYDAAPDSFGFSGPAEGRALLRKSDIELYISPSQETTSAPQENDERLEYTPPYVAFMLRAVRELGLEPSSRATKDSIEDWIRENWPDELGYPAKRKVEYMATFIRHPGDEKGGHFKRGRNS